MFVSLLVCIIIFVYILVLVIEMARKPLRTRVITLGSSSQQVSTQEKGSSSQQAPTHEEQAHHEPLDVEE